MRPNSLNSHGLSTGLVLLVVLLVSVLGVTLATSSSTQLWFTQRTEAAIQARNGARSVVAAAIEELYQSEKLRYGSSGESLELELGSLDSTRLTFDRDQAQRWQIPYSTNNIESTRTTLGWGGRAVPAGSIHLVGVARSGRVERTVEAVLRVEHFPYAIAASGPIQSSGALLVATLDEEQPEQLGPADIVTNSPSTTALVLPSNSVVTGDAQASGRVTLGNSTVEVWGEVRSGADPVQLQRIELDELDPLGNRPHETLTTGFYSGATDLEGTVRREGDLTVAGDLEMDAAFLFVTGRLSVTGNLSGGGIVVANQGVSVNGMTSLAGVDKLALLSGDTLELQGNGAETSTFRGLVYSRGDFRAERISVQGALVVDGTPETTLVLQDSRILYEPLVVESTGSREWLPLPLTAIGGEPLVPIINFELRTFEFYSRNDIGAGVREFERFLADPTSYPGVSPVRDFPMPEFLFEQPGPSPAHDLAWENLRLRLESELATLVPTLQGRLAIGTRDAPGPLLKYAQSVFTDEKFKTEGVTLAHEQSLELGEFLRPEERTKLLYWRESGALSPQR